MTHRSDFIHEVYLFFMYIRIYSHNLISAAFMIDEISICIRFEGNRKLANLTGMQLIIIRFADTHIVLKCSILQGLFKGLFVPAYGVEALTALSVRYGKKLPFHPYRCR